MALFINVCADLDIEALLNDYVCVDELLCTNCFGMYRFLWIFVFGMSIYSLDVLLASNYFHFFLKKGKRHEKNI